jgi:hypothetical protein
MITITETRDWELAWCVSQDKSIVERITNDEWGALDSDTRKCHVKLIVGNPKNHTLIAKNGEHILGCFVLDCKDEGVFELHTMLLPWCHGKMALEASRLGLEFCKGLKDIKKIQTFCPMNHKEILLFALLCGFKKIGNYLGGWIKDGMKFDLVKVEKQMGGA